MHNNHAEHRTRSSFILSNQSFDLYVAAAIALIIFAVLWRTWGKWGDMQFDFGREVYVPWQISQGKVLYRDLAYFNGPLTPYLNALTFSIFKPSLNTLFMCNAAILAIFSFIYWKICCFLTTKPASLAALSLFFTLSAFNSITPANNYNFISPYSHELTYGLTVIFAGFALLRRFIESPAYSSSLALGAVIGVSALIKPEIAIAAAAGIGCGVCLTVLQTDRTAASGSLLAAAFAAGFALPVALALAALSLAMPWSEALSNLTVMWRMLLNQDIVNMPFYRGITGLDNLRDSIGSVAISVGLQLGVLFFLSLCSLGSRLLFSLPRWISGLLPVCLTFSLYFLLPFGSQVLLLHYIPKSWPLLLFVLIIIMLIRYFHNRNSDKRHQALLISFAVMAFFLTLKIILNASFELYGIFLLIPSSLIWCILLIDYYPRLFKAEIERRTATLCAIATCLLILSWPALRISLIQLDNKIAPVKTTRGQLLTNQRGAYMAKALNYIMEHSSPNETLAVLPEGAMLNFLAGLPNPTPYINLMPPEWVVFGEDTIENAYRSNPPDWVILLHKSTEEYGYGYFGRGYGQGLASFIEHGYQEMALVGARPLRDESFGLLVLRRKP